MKILRNLALISALSLSGGVFAAPPVDINSASAPALAEAIKGVLVSSAPRQSLRTVKRTVRLRPSSTCPMCRVSVRKRCKVVATI